MNWSVRSAPTRVALALGVGAFAWGSSGIAQAWDLGYVQEEGEGEGVRKTLALDLRLFGVVEGTAEQLPPVVVDNAGQEFDTGPLVWNQLRLGGEGQAVYHWAVPLVVRAGVEGYVYSGQLTGGPNLDGVDLPASVDQKIYARQAYGTVSIGPFLTLGGGLMTSQWGLGLLANSGDAVYEPGSARFGNPYLGDTNLRLLAATGPWMDEVKLQLFAFRDQVVEDEILLPGDEATQWGGGLRFDHHGEIFGGVYVVNRRQDAQDGAYIDVQAVDVNLGGTLAEGAGWKLSAEGEFAVLSGETTLAPSFDFNKHEIRQVGAAARAKLDMGRWGSVLDVIYASGDQNLADGEQNNFRADRNFEVGLLLFRHLLAAQTGYAPTTASNPDLTGVPPEDLDRFPSRGGVTNTWSFFPRAYYQPMKNLEIYGGPLLAFSEVPMVDPLNTNFNGGRPTNALGGEPGQYLGTELDVGLRGSVDVSPLKLSAGLEGGLLVPGGAFDDESGESLSPIFGTRAMLRVEF